MAESPGIYEIECDKELEQLNGNESDLEPEVDNTEALQDDPDLDLPSSASIKNNTNTPDANKSEKGTAKVTKVRVTFTQDIRRDPNAEVKVTEDAQTKEKVENRPRLLIFDQSGEGAVYSIRVDLAKEKLLTGKTVEPEYWRPLRALKDYGVCVCDNYLYIIGGFSLEDRKCQSTVYRFDPLTNEWEKRCEISTARCKLTVCVMSGKIVITGGEKSDGKSTAACEIYDPDLDTWSKCGMLPSPRKSHACASAGNMVFISGGVFGKQPQRNMWVYEHYGWHELDDDYPQELKHGLERHTMVFLDNTLYFIGGIKASDQKDVKEESETMSADTQHHHHHLATGQLVAFKPTVTASRKENRCDLICPWDWELPDMPTSRCNAGYFTMGKRIYVVGGTVNGTGPGLQDMICYDTETKMWQTYFTMPCAMFSSATCVILDYPPRKPKQDTPWVRAESTANSDDSPDGMMGYVKRWVLW